MTAQIEAEWPSSGGSLATRSKDAADDVAGLVPTGAVP
jgi:hypothetical protein